MTNQAIPEPAPVCDSCGDRTTTPPACEDCRAERVAALAKVLGGGWQPSTEQVRFLLDEIGRLRDTIARRGEEYDGLRAALEIEYGNARNAEIARDDAEERARYHQNKRSAEAREVADIKAERDRLAGQVQTMRDWADRMEAEAPRPAPGGFFADEIRRVLDGAS